MTRQTGSAPGLAATVAGGDHRVVVRAAFGEHWRDIARILGDRGLPLADAHDQMPTFVVAEESVVVGCAALERHGSAALLRSVAVTQRAERLGVGRSLVEACIAQARASGIITLALLTESAEDFFRRFGFQAVPWTAIPGALSQSAQFRGGCPSSATAMILELGRASAPPAIAIRPATVHDGAAVLAIYNEGIRGRRSTFETVERTAVEIAPWWDGVAPRPVLVALDADRVVGWARAGEYSPRPCYAGVGDVSVYVDAGARGRGVGGRLLAELIVASEQRGYWKLVGRIFPENSVSRSLFSRHGFRDVGVLERHGELDGAWRDVLLVERLLTIAGLA